MYRPDLHFHFTGIGGSGMSGLAEILITQGFKVSGSDLKGSSVTDRLAKLGAQIFIGHETAHLPAGCTALVYSSAVTHENPELVEAKRRNIPVIRRAEVLAELMRLKFGVAVAGSHGKTTTTSMVAAVLERGGLDPTVVIGGQVKAIGSGSKLGKGDYLVAESDESDQSFLLLKPTIAVVTNIDAEHLSAYNSLAQLEASFHQFVSAVPFYGLAVLCIDDARVRDLAQNYTGRKVTYGFSPDAMLRALNLRHHLAVTTYEVWDSTGMIAEVSLPIPGKHMVVNSLAAFAVGIEFGVAPAKIAEALSAFGGVERRLEVIGHGGGVLVMNDYGHHPAEIRATLSAVRDGWGSSVRRIHVVFQPHRYTRTRDCFPEFIEAFRDCDTLVLTDIYTAGEAPVEGVSGEVLFEAISHPSKRYIPDIDAVVDEVVPAMEPGDMLVCLGAGSVGKLPKLFLERLEERPALAVIAG